MIGVVEDFIDRTHGISSEAVLKKLFLDAVKSQGYENAVFARAQNRRLISIPWSEFPTSYLETYRAEEWDRIDPVVHRVHGSSGPFHWSDTYSRNGMTREQKDFFGSCRELGVHSGITIPIRRPNKETDLISLSLRVKDRTDEARLADLYMLSVQYWLKYCELADRPEIAPCHLTPQELQCLLWCKEGKTNWEIGEILRISEKTVEFHLGNTMRKLGAANRITAVVIGIKRGFIAL
jgi:DNA-binding CsgD family transcriptional regulator